MHHHIDHHTSQSDVDVPKIIHLQDITNHLLDAFTDTHTILKLHVSPYNTMTKINVPLEKPIMNEPKSR